MEDGDDDTPLTAEGQSGKDNQGSTEDDTITSKDECKEPSSTECFTSILQKEGSPQMLSTDIGDSRECTSDDESENKIFNSDPIPAENSSDLLDDNNCDETKGMERESLQASEVCEQSGSSQVLATNIWQKDVSETCEEKSEHLCSGEEGNASLSTEETENMHSMEEEQEEKEPMEEEEEKENQMCSHDLVASKLSEGCLQEATESTQHSSDQNEESGDENSAQQKKKSNKEPYKSDLQNSSDEEESTSQVENDFVDHCEKSNLQSDNYEEECTSQREKDFVDHCEKSNLQSDNYEEECTSQHEKDFVDHCEKSNLKSDNYENDCKFQIENDYVDHREKSNLQSDNCEDDCKSQIEKDFVDSCEKSNVICDNYEDDCNSPVEKDFIELSDKSDLQCENYEDDCNSQSEREYAEKSEKHDQQDDSNQEERVFQEERDSDLNDDISDTLDETMGENSELPFKSEEQCLVKSSEVSSARDNDAKVGESCVNEFYEVALDMPGKEEVSSGCREEEEEEKEDKLLSEEHLLEPNHSVNESNVCETNAEQNLLEEKILPCVSEDGEALSKSENVVSEWTEEMSSEPEIKETKPSVEDDEREEYDDASNQVETSTDSTKYEQATDMDVEEMVSDNGEKDVEINDENSVKTSESGSTESHARTLSPFSCIQELTRIETEDCDENVRSENYLSTNQAKNVEKLEHEVSLKVNGEVELTKNDILDEKDTGSAKEKVGLKRKHQASPTQESSGATSPLESIKGNVHFKGFKKRYIAQVSEATVKESLEGLHVPEESRVKNKRPVSKKLILESPQVLLSPQSLPDGTQSNTPLTEYAQYLGLQPTVKFKCYNCGESGFPSMLKLQEHQNICLKNIRIQTYNKPPPTPVIEPAPSTNFRITRKVYLCSACGTYYENWNLFLHMREVHKRHICLFCLLMFSQADKLALHLSAKHGIVDSSYSSPEQFLNEFKGSFFVMCCSCEQMFSERDNFFGHMCKDETVVSTDQACSLCGLKGAHFPTCRRAFTDSSTLATPSPSNQQPTIVNTNNDSSQHTQLNVQEKPLTTSKYMVSTDKSTTGRKSLHKISDQSAGRSDKSRNTTDLDDDYDISDAASYCHVNIHEPDKLKSSPDGKVNNNETSDDTNIIVEKPINKMQSGDDEGSDGNEEDGVVDDAAAAADDDDDDDDDKQSKSSDIFDETVKDDSEGKVKCDSSNETDEFVTQNEPSQQTEITVPSPSTITKDAELQPEVDERLQLLPAVSSVMNENKDVDISHETPLNESKSPKDGGDSESDTSISGADTHDSDGSSSSSEASSEENEQGQEPQKVIKSDDSDIDRSDSDKMSIVVDETRSEDETDKHVNVNDNHNSPTVNKNETQEIIESKHDNSVEFDFKMSEEKFLANSNETGEELQDNIQIAGDDVPLLELTLEETLDALSIQTVVKECVKISCSTCVYCNHAKKIAVNGKQLVLHLLAEHRFEPVVCSDSGELTPVFGFVDNLRAKLSELQDMYFNTDTYDSADKSFTRPYDRTYECFHCHFITTLHKELYVHNRKMHQKTILLCIMCKSNFYSYSELLCHLCPGIYVPDSNILFRCCLCVVDGLPSAFRLMVHLRKRHHACDVCLETTGDQQKLSNHVWKHKLHHLCYRCGIAYRNKPDITKHLFWKHGTESVLCKKCLQKKWPHVYHFCIPPTAFLCEECNASFSRAVALKVHKRLHAGDISYQCDECEEKFISKKLVRRHKEKHKQVNVDKENHENDGKTEENDMNEFRPSEPKLYTTSIESDNINKDVRIEASECVPGKSAAMGTSPKTTEAPGENPSEPYEFDSNKQSEEVPNNKKSKVVDVYDLPPLNLSSESDDSDEEQANKQVTKQVDPVELTKTIPSEEPSEMLKSQDGEPQTEEETQPVQIVDGVWDNFKTYKANLEKREILQAQASGSLISISTTTTMIGYSVENHAIVDVVMADHDYCVLPEKSEEEKNTHLTSEPDQILSCNTITPQTETVENSDDKSGGFGVDHNYCFSTSPHAEEAKESIPSVPQTASNPPLQDPPLPLPHSSPSPPPSSQTVSTSTSPKKKQKSPKKKQKQSGSSSSSDSSSNSDSSSCTCGTNCSCSSSSSSSSGSSSTSSDSDSSSSEGRRRQAARRERRRERAKRKLDSGSKGGTPPPAFELSAPMETGGGIAATAVETTPTPMQIDSSGAGTLLVDDSVHVAAPEPEETDFLIRESDLDTTETETDEDFYDKYPQKQANKLLAEKRNQLLLLAAVAPVNNGTIAQPSSPPAPEIQEPTQKKRGKTKRHKKTQHNSSEKKVESKLKLNIPVSYYSNPSFSVGNAGHAISSPTNSQNPTSSHTSRLSQDTFSPVHPEASSTPTAYHSTGSGSETESKRLSKRKRIPKKFYGDSSDEEAEQTPQQPFKWRKVTPTLSNNPPSQPASVSSGFGYRSVTCNVIAPEPVHIQPLHQEKSDDDDAEESDSGHEAKRSSSDSSNSDSDNEQSDADSDNETVTTVSNIVTSVSGNATQQKNENLYCYCQCPYDEVSEMIACDGKDCSIEWFHFECVGIMVPPKGKWFCPDCRKKTGVRNDYSQHP